MDKKTLNYLDNHGPKVNTLGFPFASLKQTLELLDCSKFYLYKLVRKKVLSTYYLEKNEKGQPTGKPYFKLEEIEKTFFTDSK
ncbi:MAG: hypothetical protein KDC79_13985 [Cyclobacteriaceae bacterium]|nr:hypothetical protein [Cyclobacteriaceae bacterium]